MDKCFLIMTTIIAKDGKEQVTISTYSNDTPALPTVPIGAQIEQQVLITTLGSSYDEAEQKMRRLVRHIQAMRT
jgi:hypothetical protein